MTKSQSLWVIHPLLSLRSLYDNTQAAHISLQQTLTNNHLQSSLEVIFFFFLPELNLQLPKAPLFYHMRSN